MLADSRRKAREEQKRLGGIPLGIKCDECGAELVNPKPESMLPTYPPKIHATCPSCGWVGYVTA